MWPLNPPKSTELYSIQIKIYACKFVKENEKFYDAKVKGEGARDKVQW